MNTDRPIDAPASPPELPPLSNERVDEIENSLFAEISRDRTVRRKRRTGVWLATGAAAAVIVVAAVIAPSLSGVVGGASSDEYAVAPSAPLVESGTGEGGAADSGAESTEQSIAGERRSPATARSRPSATSSRRRRRRSSSTTSRLPPP